MMKFRVVTLKNRVTMVKFKVVALKNRVARAKTGFIIYIYNWNNLHNTTPDISKSAKAINSERREITVKVRNGESLKLLR
jgi:hypothetical protein